METTFTKELKDILLRRRNKVIIKHDNDICNIFKNNILKRISEIEILKNCEIENVSEISVILKVKNISLEFIDGELKNLKEIENIKCEYEVLSKIIKEETNIIKEKMVLALSFNENLSNLGYSMDEKMFRIVSTLDIKDIETLYNEIIPTLKIMVGANVEYHPLYPNFPRQVIEMKNIQLYINAILHYWTNGHYIPYSKVEENEKTNVEVQYKNISIGKEEDIHEIMYNLMNAAEAISEQDINDLTTYFTNYKDFIKYVPDTIGNKENLAVTVNLIIKYSEEIPMDKIVNMFSTVTDVLRLAAVMSNQSASLNNKIKFKSFSNKERRILMELLNHCGNRLEDFFRNKNIWERVCERIHPNKFKNQYPDLVEDLLGVYKFKRVINLFKKEINCYNTIISLCNNMKKNSDSDKIINDFISVADKLIKIKPKVPESIYNNINDTYLNIKESSFNKDQLLNIDIQKIQERIEELNIKIIEGNNNIKIYKESHQRFASKVESTLNKKEFDETLNLLSQRPGIFSRRLDELLSKVNNNDKVLKYFEDIAPKVSVKVLLSLKGYFQKRYEKLKVRVFLIKGKTSKLHLKTDVKEALDITLCQRICKICDQALINHFRDKPKLNKVFLSEKLKKHLIPLDVRSASSSLETYSKGSRFDLSYKKLTDVEYKQYIDDLETKESTKRSLLKENDEKSNQLLSELNNKEITEEKREDINKKIEIINSNNKKLVNELEEIECKIKTAKSNLGDKEYNNVRLFIWWTNTKNNTRVDIDLSVMIYNSDFETIDHVSFSSLKNENFEIYHSGDIVDGGDVNGKGAAEFIDFNPEKVFSGGGRYIAVSVISYCGINFNKLENCKFGWMERKDLSSNELFEPKTVSQKLDLNIDKTSTTPVIFDCKTREIIWVDTTLTTSGSCVTIEGSEKQMNAILYYYLNPLKDDIYDLINLHIQARDGKLVNNEEDLSEGDIAFVPYLPYKCKEGVKYIRPTDLDIILSEYMTSSL